MLFRLEAWNMAGYSSEALCSRNLGKSRNIMWYFPLTSHEAKRWILRVSGITTIIIIFVTIISQNQWLKLTDDHTFYNDRQIEVTPAGRWLVSAVCDWRNRTRPGRITSNSPLRFSNTEWSSLVTIVPPEKQNKNKNHFRLNKSTDAIQWSVIQLRVLSLAKIFYGVLTYF